MSALTRRGIVRAAPIAIAVASVSIGTAENASPDAEDRTSTADSAMVVRIIAIPARSKEGLRFKEVLDEWKGCIRDDIEESLLSDLLHMAGLSDA